MRYFRHLPTVAIGALASVYVLDAQADDTRVAAQALFDDAMKAMAAHSYETACPKLEQVMKLQPGKVGGLMALALCYEQWGETASAWSRYRTAADAAAVASDRREAKARAKVEELAAHLSKLAVVVAAANKATTGFTVQRDGRVILTAEWDAAIPIDPGTYKLVASAPGKKSWTASVEIKAVAGTVTVQVPPLEADAPAAVTPPPPAAAPVAPSPPPSPAEQAPVAGQASTPARDAAADKSRLAHQRRVTGFVVGGVGVAGLGVAGLLGGLTLAKVGQLNSMNCPEGKDYFCTTAGQQIKTTAGALQTGALVALGIGAATAATGIALVVTAPKAGAKSAEDEARTLVAGVGLGNVSLSYTW